MAAGLVEMLCKRMRGEAVLPTRKVSSFREISMERTGSSGNRTGTATVSPVALAKTQI